MSGCLHSEIVEGDDGPECGQCGTEVPCPENTSEQCATWGCEAEPLPHMASCYEHVAPYEIPPYDEIECPECGKTGGHGTIHDDLYYCKNDDCGASFDPRRTDYLRTLRSDTEQSTPGNQ